MVRYGTVIFDPARAGTDATRRDRPRLHDHYTSGTARRSDWNASVPVRERIRTDILRTRDATVLHIHFCLYAHNPTQPNPTQRTILRHRTYRTYCTSRLQKQNAIAPCTGTVRTPTSIPVLVVLYGIIPVLILCTHTHPSRVQVRTNTGCHDFERMYSVLFYSFQRCSFVFSF